MKRLREESKIEIWGTTYINGIRNPEDINKKIIQIEPIGHNNFMVEIVEEGTTDNAAEISRLQKAIECLEKRLKHLLSSDVIRRYDEYDRKTGTYARDISKFDEKYQKYKAAYFAVNFPHTSPYDKEGNNE